MSVITDEEFANLSKIAEGIKNETKRANALALLVRMTEVIEGVGDRPRTWQPRMLKVLQAMSKMDEVIGNAKPGALVADNVVIENGLQVSPLMTWITRSMWDPNKDSNRKLCSSPDGNIGFTHGMCRQCPFSRSDEGTPPCNKEQAFLVMDTDFVDMYRMTFHKSQYKDGMEWSKAISSSKTHPFKRVYSLAGVASEKKATVKTIKATMLDVRTNALPVDELAFLEAMYHKQLSDRKAYLEDYRNYVDSRQNKPAAIEHSSSTAERIGMDEAAPSNTPNYNL